MSERERIIRCTVCTSRTEDIIPDGKRWVRRFCHTCEEVTEQEVI